MKKLFLIPVLALLLVVGFTIGAQAEEKKIGLWGCKVELASEQDKGDYWEVVIHVTNGNGVTYEKVRAELGVFENDTEVRLEKSDLYIDDFKPDDKVTFTFKIKIWSTNADLGKVGFHPHIKLYEILE